MKIVFLATGEFAVPILKALFESDNFLIDLVVSEEAKLAGRQKELTSSPVALMAENLGLELFTPKTLKDAEVRDRIISTNPDLIVVVAYGKIIPKEIFNSSPFKTVNIHPSLLPKFRGASPIQSALLEGLRETGTTLMLIDEELDTGDIISQEKIMIKGNDNYDDLEKKLVNLSIDIILRDLPLYVSGEIKAKKQEDTEASYSGKIEKEDGRINWNDSAEEIYNKWRAYYRWPGIYTFTQDNKRLNLKEILLSDNKSEQAIGNLFMEENNLFIKCGDGSIQIDQIQPEGKKTMEAKEFINGYSNLLNKKLN